MFRRLSLTERLVGLGAIVGIVSCFTGWGTSTTSTEIIKLSAFRVSILGDLYFLALAAVLVALAARGGLIDGLSRIGRWISIASHVALGAVVLQLPLNAMHGESTGKGLVLALVAAVALVILVHRPIDQPHGARFTNR